MNEIVVNGFEKLPRFSALDFPENYKDEEQVKAWWDKQEKQKRENYYLNNSGVGKKYLSKSLKDYVAETDEQKNILTVVSNFIKEVNEGKCRTLWLCGNTNRLRSRCPYRSLQIPSSYIRDHIAGRWPMLCCTTI